MTALTPQARALKRTLTCMSLEIRRVPKDEHRPEPRFVSYDMVRDACGELLTRKKVILMSQGCSVPTCTMCPFTNENNHGLGVTTDLRGQVDTVLRRAPDEPDYDVIALYNDGSFFAPREVPLEVQLSVASRVAESGVRRLVVESLPQFVTERALTPFVEKLGSTELEIGIGLQSADDLVREVLVNTSFNRTVFERAVEVMRRLGAHPKVYLMLKPPFLTEGEAIMDVLGSTEYLSALGVGGVTLCPTRVARHTVAWRLWEAGLYTPPNLWTVVDTVRRAHERCNVRVACINLRGSDFSSVFPDSCPRCADGIVDALMSYSETGDPGLLPRACTCRPAGGPTPVDHDVILSRAATAMRQLSEVSSRPT
jgi:archaeosine synthase beta-subunit